MAHAWHAYNRLPDRQVGVRPVLASTYTNSFAVKSKTRFAALLAEPVASSPEQFGAFMKSELAKYEKVVKASGARVD